MTKYLLFRSYSPDGIHLPEETSLMTTPSIRALLGGFAWMTILYLKESLTKINIWNHDEHTE